MSQNAIKRGLAVRNFRGGRGGGFGGRGGFRGRGGGRSDFVTTRQSPATTYRNWGNRSGGGGDRSSRPHSAPPSKSNRAKKSNSSNSRNQQRSYGGGGSSNPRHGHGHRRAPYIPFTPTAQAVQHTKNGRFISPDSVPGPRNETRKQRQRRLNASKKKHRRHSGDRVRSKEFQRRYR